MENADGQRNFGEGIDDVNKVLSNSRED